MKNFFKWAAIAVGVLGIGFVAGPRAEKTKLTPELPTVSQDLVQLERDIQQSEAKIDLKPDNQARIVWADSSNKQKTKYSIL